MPDFDPGLRQQKTKFAKLPNGISVGLFLFLLIRKKIIKKMQKKSLFSFSSRCQGRALFVVSKRR